MEKFKYSSAFHNHNKTRRTFGWPDISKFADLPDGEYMKMGKRYEEQLADLISQQEDGNDFLYWIIADNHTIVAGVNKFDDATLTAEALLCFSPYYSVIDVFGYSGLVWHEELLNDDPESKERRFYERTNHIPILEWPDLKMSKVRKAMWEYGKNV